MGKFSINITIDDPKVNSITLHIKNIFIHEEQMEIRTLERSLKILSHTFDLERDFYRIEFERDETLWKAINVTLTGFYCGKMGRVKEGVLEDEERGLFAHHYNVRPY